MTKFNIGDEVIYKGRMGSKGFIYKIADGYYWLREPDVPWGTIGAHFFRIPTYRDPDIQLYTTYTTTPAPTPPTDPCVGVTCSNICYGTSLYSRKCVDGHCVKDALIKSNAPECGYTPAPTPTPAPASYIRIVNGNLEMSDDKRVIYDQKMAFYTRPESKFSIITAETVSLVEMGIPFEVAKAYAVAHWAGLDPCAGVTCPNTCYGTSLYSKKCVDGHCVKGAIIKSNAPECGYIPPCPTPEFAFAVTGIDGLTVHVNVTTCTPGAGASWGPNEPGLIGNDEDTNRISNVRVGTYDYVFNGPGTYTLYLIGRNNCDADSFAAHTVTVAAPPVCTEGDKKPGYVCSGGKWVPVGTPPPPECTEGDKKPGYVCSGGKWVPVGTPPDMLPEYLTAAEATERFRMGLPCYIKCMLPILDMLPGIPYTPGAWVPPFCAITTES